jgi:sulfate/thiosulfate transport system ATP-binding protein
MYVELKDINKTYAGYQASNHVSFGIEQGRLIALLGPSGSGKTTILRMIAGLETPDSGEIVIDGKVVNNIPASERGIGFVFQNYALFRYMTVYDNIAFGLNVKKENKKYIDERVHELLKLISLDGLEKRYPSQLSGGQRQRVAFARALAPNPHLLLLDEPFAAIDAKVRQELRSWLKEMIEKLGITSIFVTHDQDEAIEVADEIIITNKGHIEQKGTPLEIYQNPQTAFAATFFGQTSQITSYQSFHSFPKVDNVDKAIIRPEFVKVSKKNEVQRFGPSASEGVVERVSFRGDSLEVLVNVNGNQIIAKRGLEEKSIAVGEKVDVFIYRLFVTVGEKAMLLENQSLVDDSVFI